MYDIFGKYGAIRQIRLGNAKDTRGTAYVVYEDIYDAKNAVDHLSGFNVANRYLIVLYSQLNRMSKKTDIKKKEDEITRLQEKYGDIYDAKNAVDHLSGFNVANRYLIVLYSQLNRMSKKTDIKKKEDEITRLQEKYGVGSKTPSANDA
ncbi:Pre-mRNA branch site p14-like protein [Triticum urartu]|uniref:Pre-mRNA branch site p14-like protein n=1 Tax=Triticum urartu TaxID=4572 RepID=M7ZY21_TRIUA|nr:Pre-mRNA branch site p14-like protein [Triticum urartu]